MSVICKYYLQKNDVDKKIRLTYFFVPFKFYHTSATFLATVIYMIFFQIYFWVATIGYWQLLFGGNMYWFWDLLT